MPGEIDAAENFELVTGPNLALITWRYAPGGVSGAALDELNERLLQAINEDGRLYLTRGSVNGRMVIRFSVGQTRTEAEHVRSAWKTIQEIVLTI